jgi:hypothetical protein
MAQPNNTDLVTTLFKLLTTHVTASLAEGLRLLLNEATLQMRSAVLHAHPYERCEDGLGHAKGF